MIVEVRNFYPDVLLVALTFKWNTTFMTAKKPKFHFLKIVMLLFLKHWRVISCGLHPSTSKSALSELLRLKKRLLPQPNNLPSSYDEAYNFVKRFVLPTQTCHVCPNDCVIFHKTDRYDYSKLQKCPVCGCSRYWANKSARRRFLYFPLGPRFRRMYGNASISEKVQSHASDRDPSEDPAICGIFMTLLPGNKLSLREGSAMAISEQ